VAGIAGPGEPLANEATLETLRLVGASHPDLLLCLSTNGLELEHRLPELLDLGLRSLTITINTTAAETATQIYAWAQLDGVGVSGREAAHEILARQWRGLELAADAGLLVKINSVLIPGVTEQRLPSVARRAAELGAARHNIIPLIPRGKMRGHPAPSPAELERVRLDCEQWLAQFRGCVLCRADAIIPPLNMSGGVSCAQSTDAHRALTRKTAG
jgi:nitrogen fixation protein NifB